MKDKPTIPRRRAQETQGTKRSNNNHQHFLRSEALMLRLSHVGYLLACKSPGRENLCGKFRSLLRRNLYQNKGQRRSCRAGYGKAIAAQRLGRSSSRTRFLQDQIHISRRKTLIIIEVQEQKIKGIMHFKKNYQQYFRETQARRSYILVNQPSRNIWFSTRSTTPLPFPVSILQCGKICPSNSM